MSEARRARMQSLRHYDGKDADGVQFEPVDHVIILAPGPSLLRCTIPEGPIRIGVNGAAQAVRCDIWAFYDKVCRDDFTAIGTPAIVTSLPPMEKRYQHLRQKFRGFGSIGCALSVAWHLGAKNIDVYGCDWSGDDHAIPNARLIRKGFLNPPGRWANERELFGMLQAELLKTWEGRHPTVLTRIMPE